jgi:hypothetical protein
MAEYNFCLSDIELNNLITKLFERHFFLVPLAYYRTSNYLTVNSNRALDDFYASELGDRNFFANQYYLINSEYQDDLFYASSLEINGDIYFTIDRVGGCQAIELNIGESRPEVNCIRLVPSMLGYQKLFWDKELTKSRKPSEALLNAYKEIKEIIGKLTRPTKVLGSTIYISKKIIEECKGKNLQVCIYDEIITFN